jgi:peptide/nickel transport system ATP-binding protein
MSKLLLDIAGLTVRFGDRLAVDNVGLTLASSEVLGVVGESGSGKTLLARAILGLLPHGAAFTADRMDLLEQDLIRVAPETWRRLRGPGVGLVLQEPLTSLNPAMTIGDQLTEGLRLHHGMRRADASVRAREALAEVQIDDPLRAMQRYPHEFSGGQRQRILIASVLSLEPRLIIADEPATALDALVGEEILDLIKQRAQAIGAAVLMISHDLAQVARRADRILVMEQGRVVDEGIAAQVLLAPRHAYTRRLLEAIPRRGATQPPARSGAAPILAARDLALTYPGTRRGLLAKPDPVRALAGVSFELRAGETLAVIGESGSGKSSLAMLALGLCEPTGGELLVEGGRWASRSGAERRALRRRVQVVFQDPASSLDPRMRIAAIVGEGLRYLSAGARAQRVGAVLAEVGLAAGHAERFPHQLSGGQRQRVAIARALVMDPEVVIADEPVSALDVTVQAQILELLERLKQERGFALLFITHDLGVVERIADRVIVMRQGLIVESGTRDEVFDTPRHEYTRRLLSIAPALVQDGTGFRLERRHIPEPADA